MRAEFLRLAAAGLVCATISTLPAIAQPASPEELEALISPASDPAAALALARRQAADQDLLGAAGTLERLLLAHPDEDNARLLYAGLLCRLDDPQGAQVELSLLGGRAVPEPDWAELEQACGPVPRPASERNGE